MGKDGWIDRLILRVSVAACMLAMVGASFLLIGHHGSSTPITDQWDAEALALLQPYLNGTLRLSAFFGFQNEHRILYTRALALVLFLLRGYWDPVLEMLANCVIHAIAIGVLLVALSRPLDRFGFVFLAVFTALLRAVPFGWENVLTGFQSQFYFLLLLGAASLLLLTRARAFEPRWWFGTGLGVAGYFTGASGATTLAAAAALSLLQMAVGARHGRRELLGVGVHAVLVVIMVFDIPNLAGPDEFKASSIGQFVDSALLVAGWPAADSSWPTWLKCLAAFAVYGPVLLATWRLVLERTSLADNRWVFLAFGAWLALQIVAVAYGRAAWTQAPRYVDLFAAGLLLNGACVLSFVRLSLDSPRARLVTVGAACWITLVLVFAGQRAVNDLPRDLAFHDELAGIRTLRLKDYLRTGDFADLASGPAGYIPYPSAERLRDMLAQPSIREMLPPSLRDEPEPVDRGPGLEAWIHRATAAFERSALGEGPLLLPIGIALFFVVALGAYARASRE
jgi:hypothetical protein